MPGATAVHAEIQHGSPSQLSLQQSRELPLVPHAGTCDERIAEHGHVKAYGPGIEVRKSGVVRVQRVAVLRCFDAKQAGRRLHCAKVRFRHVGRMANAGLRLQAGAYRHLLRLDFRLGGPQHEFACQRGCQKQCKRQRHDPGFAHDRILRYGI
jgi:hypothetical protein